MKEIADNDLIESLQNGDLRAFDALFAKYSGRVYGFAIKYLKSKEESEEIVQDLFLKIWEKRNDLDKDSCLKAYLFTVTYHSICRAFRKRSYQENLEKQLITSANGTYNLEERIDYESLLIHVNELIDKLPAKQKIIFIKSRREGKNSREIAAELNLVPGTVDNNISEALKFIRYHLSRESLSLMLFYHIFIR